MPRTTMSASICLRNGVIGLSLAIDRGTSPTESLPWAHASLQLQPERQHTPLIDAARTPQRFTCTSTAKRFSSTLNWPTPVSAQLPDVGTDRARVHRFALNVGSIVYPHRRRP